MKIKHVFLLSLLCLWFVFTSVSCKRQASVRTRKKAKQKLDELSKIMLFSFPASTRLLGYERRRGMNDVIYLKIEIATEDLRALINNSPFCNTILRSSENNPISDISSTGPTWWKVKSVRTWKSGQVRLDNANYLNMLIDLDQKNKCVIYLEWFET